MQSDANIYAHFGLAVLIFAYVDDWPLKLGTASWFDTAMLVLYWRRKAEKW